MNFNDESSTGSKTLSRGFLWRDRHGDDHSIFDMETSYVFFVLRMIWNHSTPDHMRMKPYKFYDNLFNHPHFTNAYVKAATIAMIMELSTRDDLTAYFQAGIDHMRKWASAPGFMESLTKDQKEQLRELQS